MTTEWEAATTKRIGGTVRRLREQAGLTAVELSDAAQGQGFELTKANVLDLETGRKKTLTVADFLGLAAVLQVSPLEMLFPELPNGEVEAIPGRLVRSIDAALWASGERPLPLDDPDAQADAELRLRTTLMAKSLRLVELEAQFEFAKSELERCSASEQQIGLTGFRSDFSRAEDELHRHMEYMGLIERSPEEDRRKREEWTKAKAANAERRRRRERRELAQKRGSENDG